MRNTTFIDRKYINFLSNRLINYRDKGNGTFEFAHCERPGSNKRRGYFYQKGDGYNFYCHNCQSSTKFFKFLESQDPTLFKEYKLELFKDEPRESTSVVTQVKEEPKIVVEETEDLVSILKLPKKHSLWGFIKKRKLGKYLVKEDLFYTPDFPKWAATLYDSFKEVTLKEDRLCIAYRNREGEIVGFTCRSLGNSSRKYIELKLSDEELVYGLNRVDLEKPILCVEGPIDAMFLDNCVAVGGASYKSDFIHKHKDNIVIVPDNDWVRNKEVCQQIINAANAGLKVALLPSHIKGKDINEIIQNGMTKETLHSTIFDSVKQGGELILEISTRRKC